VAESITSARVRAFREGILEGRLFRLCLFRMAVAGTGLAAFLASGYRTPDFDPLSLAQFHLLVGEALVNFVYIGLLRTSLDRRALIMGQLAIDVLVISGLVFVASPLGAQPYFLFAVVFLAALLLGGRSAIGFAAFSSVLYGFVAVLYYGLSVAGRESTLEKLRTWVMLEDLTPFGRPEFVLQAVLFVVALHLVAWLAGRLAEEISRVRILNDEILQNMAGGVIAIDRAGGIAFANPQAASLLGLRDPPARLVGRDYIEAFPGEVSALFRRALQDQERTQQEILIGGRHLEVSISRLADGRGGGVRGAVAILNDLTLRHEMERMSERAERFRVLLEMSAGIAHEIRNPLASIRGAAQELEASTLPTEDDRQLMKVVLRESDRLDKIVSDFLEYASDRPLEFSLVDVPEILREVEVLLRARDEGKVVVIRMDSPRHLEAKGSHDRLKQVFINLGLNAIEACGPGGQVQVRCAPASSPGDHRPGVRVEFEDNGPGIPEEDTKRLFSPFFTTKPRGTGMGLAIARKIVTAHGGTITLDSVEGKGAIARIWLPAS
jgi:PAS domain S-box-containing protein